VFQFECHIHPVLCDGFELWRSLAQPVRQLRTICVPDGVGLVPGPLVGVLLNIQIDDIVSLYFINRYSAPTAARMTAGMGICAMISSTGALSSFHGQLPKL
jgi:hypothetical protein